MNSQNKSSILLNVPNAPGLTLRAANESDLEHLRTWKNKEKQFFYHQSDISETQQKQWFEAFKTRPNDFMFMTVFEGQVFGCMGIRLKENYWDVYNVIVGRTEFGGRGLMGHSFAAMLEFAISIQNAPITLEVLKNNPAVSWYQKQGFVIIETHENYFKMLFKTNELS